MATTVNDVFEAVYIIRVPVAVSVLKTDETWTNDTHSIVQVGKAGGGTYGFRRRMLQHMRAWLMATGEYAKICGKTERQTPQSLYTFPTIIDGENAQDIVGIIPKFREENDEDSEEDAEGEENVAEAIADVESFIRGLIGVSLRRKAIKDLLTVPFESIHAGVYVKGKSGFSDSELRVVHNDELKMLRQFFADKWAINEPVGVKAFVDHLSQFHRALIPSRSLRLIANYSDKPPSSDDRGNRQLVDVEFVSALSCLIENREVDDVSDISIGVHELKLVQ